MSNNPVADSLKSVLADSYALFLKTQNFHWNVTGKHFQQLHTLFETQYRDLFDAIDEIAERIRTLGEKAPAGFDQYNELSSIGSGNENAGADEMVKTLKEDQQKIVTSLNKALQIAEQANDEVTADMMIGRLKIHQKNAWMLAASIGEEINASEEQQNQNQAVA